jgi:predicted aconitase
MLDEDELYRDKEKSWATLDYYPTVCSERLMKTTNKTQSGYSASGQTTRGKTGFHEVLRNTQLILVCGSCHSVSCFTDKYRYITTKCYRVNHVNSTSPVTVSYSMAYIHRRMV